MATKNTNVENALAILAPEVVTQLKDELREEVRAELVGRLSEDAPATRKRRVAKPAKKTTKAKADSETHASGRKRKLKPEKGSKASANRIKCKDGRSASQFIRDLDDSEGEELPAAEVVARAKEEQDIEIKATLVNNVRTNRRKKNGEPKRKPGRKATATAADDSDDSSDEDEE